ncbi:MAG: HAMP domain-containing sensor histidine kinase, partial [Bacteroidota bacterium]|nr:HAMP domain-containing sensor histidine kinase [Bacteroidota bacterium]
SRIIIEVQTTEDYVNISVKDFGIGIKNIEDIFKYNKKTIVLGTEDEKGKGIGLMFSAELVKKNNGKIWVESELEKGSTFYFTLPKG